MSETRKITIVNADDWVWVFADEKVIYDGHSCSAEQLLEALNYEDWEAYEVPSGYDNNEIANFSHDPHVTPSDFEPYRI